MVGYWIIVWTGKWKKMSLRPRKIFRRLMKISGGIASPFGERSKKKPKEKACSSGKRREGVKNFILQKNYTEIACTSTCCYRFQ